MLINKCPKVTNSNLPKIIGQPEDYAKMALKLALENRQRVNATIPGDKAVPEAKKAQEEDKKEDIKNEDNKKSPEEDTKVAKPPRISPSASKPIDTGIITPLKELKKDMNKWTIKVRVVKKHDNKPCKKGAGVMQKIDFVDKEGTSISALLFDDSISKLGEQLKEGKVKFSSPIL